MRSLIVGDGYVAATLAEHLRHSGVSVEQVSRSDRPELDRLLGAAQPDQVVVVPDTGNQHANGLVDRVDGPRWLVCSQAERSRPLEGAVLERGGTVFSLSTVFGLGGDDNVTRLARAVRRYRTPVGLCDGERLVQPLHVDDLAAIVGLHLQSPASGDFEIAGPEAVPVAELSQSIVEILGVPLISHVITPFVRVVDGRGPLARAAIDWHDGHAPVGIHPARAQFGWSPLALGVRVAQAVHEAVA